MELWFEIFIAAILVGVLVLLLRRGKGSGRDSIVLLQNQMNEITRTLDLKLGESTKVLQQQFGESAKIIKEITQELTKVGEGQKQVVDIAKQLENLQDILKNPKQRGVLGEYYLETVLKNVLPPGSFEMQYAFKDGTAVDAVVFV